MAALKLFYSPNSPYSRKCRVVALEKRLDVAEHKASPRDNPPELLSVNPLGKVPALLAEGQAALCDSALICEFLDQQPSEVHPLFPAEQAERLRALSMAALGDGLMDVSVELFHHKNRREDQQWPDLMERRHQGILRTIDYVSRHQFANDAMLDIGTLTLACALSFIHLRLPEIQWEHSHPDLDRWLAHVLKRPSFEHTQAETA